MKTAQEIYEQYKIMPSLQLHHLRVASVGKLLSGSVKKPVDAHAVILACLFHDMSNIIKSNLKYFPDFCEPEGVAYWEQVKQEYVEKYGSDHHAATVGIVKEVGLPRRAVELIEGVGYSKLETILAGEDLEQKICEYADTRVGPHGVLPLKERLAEGRARYLETKN